MLPSEMLCSNELGVLAGDMSSLIYSFLQLVVGIVKILTSDFVIVGSPSKRP